MHSAPPSPPPHSPCRTAPPSGSPAVRGAPALGPLPKPKAGRGGTRAAAAAPDSGVGRKRAEPPAPGPPPLGSGAELRRKCRARAVRNRYVGWNTVTVATTAAAFVAAAAACFYPATVDAITPPSAPCNRPAQAPAPQPSGAGPPLLPQTRVLPRAGGAVPPAVQPRGCRRLLPRRCRHAPPSLPPSPPSRHRGEPCEGAMGQGREGPWVHERASEGSRPEEWRSAGS